MHLTTWIYTQLFGEKVGEDSQGNVYYCRKRGNRREQRWVAYHGTVEASRVPPEWHGWLHYTYDATPEERTLPQYAWQKPHQPNLTGTALAYLPEGHGLKGAHRSASTSDYEPWQPSESL